MKIFDFFLEGKYENFLGMKESTSNYTCSIPMPTELSMLAKV